MRGLSLFTDRQFKSKLFAGFMGVAALSGAGGAFGVVQQAQLARGQEAMYANGVLPAQLLDQARSSTLSTRSDVISALNSNFDLREFAATALTQGNQASEKALTALAAHRLPNAERALVTRIRADLQSYNSQMEALVALPLESSAQRANLTADTDVTYSAIKKEFDDLSADVVHSGRTNYLSAHAAARRSKEVTLALLAVAFLTAAAVGVLLARAMARPLAATSAVIQAMASGDLTGRVRTRGRDEFATMGNSLNQALGTMSDTVRDIEATVAVLASSSEELSSVSLSMASGAEETSVQAEAVSSAIVQVTDGVMTVSASAEQMGASIREISRNAHDAAQVAATAASTSDAAMETVGRFGSSSRDIDRVVKVIRDIAQQTHLIALNATIEAARAGDAGAGFAVVAHEVKLLASETASATKSIEPLIRTLQSEAEAVSQAFTGLQSGVGTILAAQSMIAGAVEEQTATTNAISQSIADAASASGEVSRNIAGVADGARVTSGGASNTEKAARELAALAGRLQNQVSQFRIVDRSVEVCGDEALV